MHLLSLLLCLAGIIHHAQAQCPYMHRELFRKGSKSCVVGHAAVYGGDGQGSRHTTSKEGPITSGQIIADGGFKVKLTRKDKDDVVLKDSERDEDDGSLTTYPETIFVDEVYSVHATIPKAKVKVMENGKEVEKEVEKKFKGVQIVLSSTAKVTTENLYPEEKSTKFRQIDENCDQRAGVTHRDGTPKETGVIALLKCTKKDADFRLDVNILVETREWYYSQYILNCKAPPPPKNGTNVPTMDQTKAPTQNPVKAPVKAPVTAPVKAPNMAPPAPVQTKPPVSSPMRSPMQPTWTASVSPMWPGIAPSGRVPISSPVATPSVGTPNSATQFPVVISTVPPSFGGDSSMNPTSKATPSPVVVRFPSILLPTLFTPVSVSCCGDTKVNGQQGNRQLRTVCGPCPEFEH
jgi:hypothetical protein